MNRTILGLCLAVNLYAQSYEELLEHAVNNNINLQLLQNQQEQISLNGEIERRYENPSLELEVANFSSQFLTKSNDFGARMGISQSILLPHIQKDRERITQTQRGLSQKEYELERSRFVYNFNRRYLAYKRAKSLAQLQLQAIALADEILQTVNQRYQEGAVAKSDYLEAQLDYQKSQSRQSNLVLEVSKAKDELLAFANVKGGEFVERNHLFLLKQKSVLHPLLALNEAKKEVSHAKVELLKHTVDSVEVFSELEQEPEQTIFRVGLSVDLPTFNQHSQERQLEKIKIANEALRSSSQERSLAIQVAQLTAQNSQLKGLKEGYQSLVTSQEELFEMYRQSYTIAKVNLLKLQQIKAQRVTNQEKILENNFAIEQNIIKINYLQGAYNE